MRSKLFVPGSRPELFDKALAGPADALSFDLEDAVAEPHKAAAREALATLLQRPGLAEAGKLLIVRCNPVDSPHFAADVAAVVRPGLQLLNLPKPGSVDEVLAAVAAVEAAERAHGVTEPVRLLLNIETPRALRGAHALAAAHPRVAGLQMGLGDLFESLGIARDDAAAVHAVMLQVRLAAGEAPHGGVWACDGAYARFADEAGFTAEAQQARRLGFIGKSCIHPRQVPLANAVFQPTPDEIARARRLVQAAAEAAARGQGAGAVAGEMVDAPFLHRAEALLAQARRLGLDAG